MDFSGDEFVIKFEVCLHLLSFQLHRIPLCKDFSRSLTATDLGEKGTYTGLHFFISEKNLSAKIVFVMQTVSCTTLVQQRYASVEKQLAHWIKRIRHSLFFLF